MAQCAGNDTTISICDYANPANQTINLFNSLTGTPTPGGTWTDPLQTGALNSTTGILNLWNIHISGVYHFTYTVPNVAGCTDNTAVLTVNVGGYSGITSPNASACSDDEFVNLFQFFTGDSPSPHLNGYWTDDSNSGALNGSNFNALQAGIGVYNFTYHMAAVGNCPAVSSTAMVTVYRVPFSGIPFRIIICTTADFTQLTNVNLFDFLSGEDSGGQWSEFGTSELSDPFDPFIDIQHLYNTFGIGSYNFTYTVYPDNPVCEIKKSTVQLVIEEPLDFTGAVFTVGPDICENEMSGTAFTATLTQGTIINPLGSYKIFYTVSGIEHIVANAAFNPTTGLLVFPIPAAYFPQVGDYTVTITHIIYLGNFGACENIIDATDTLSIYPIPKINLATLTIPPTCGNVDVVVQLSGNHNLEDGTSYELTYNLSGVNTLAAQHVTVTIENGSATFTIPAASVPNNGTTTITIVHIKNLTTGCENTSTLSKSFQKNIFPNVTNLTAVIADRCEGQAVSVQISGLGSLTNITLQYDLSGANTASDQSITVTAVSGTATFVIPAALIPNLGTTTFTVLNLINNITTCSSTVVNVFGNFAINAIPDLPVAQDQTFCNTANATVANLIPNGSQYLWYDSPGSGSPLDNATPLVSGNYYLAEINGSLCISGRTMIAVVINVIPEPTLNQGGEKFCGADNPTLQTLSANLNSPESIVWYDAPSNGNALDNSQLLQDNFTYYAYGFSDVSNCQSEQSLAVTVTLTDCSQNEYALFIPDGFSPNGDGVNETFHIPDIEFLFPNYDLEIYNRFGNLLYTGNRNIPEWDGR
ncbi:MAG TPA: gliding motility-associated C-terminal domain-containing protein, partial [Flavobacterium sp.]|nr:gliding motility-associated C-terminal domain-containing protein [Flavobacterium sp.]